MFWLFPNFARLAAYERCNPGKKMFQLFQPNVYQKQMFFHLFQLKKKKSHTCEEGGVPLRISFWHLLMNLKNNYLFGRILGHFLLFCLSKNPKNQNFEKMKKFAGDIIILHMCSKNHNHIMYGS